MPAGSVVAPSIIPLRSPLPGQHKSIISSNVKIELWTESKDAKVYYTINGTRPEPFQKFGDRCTKLYSAPFTLPAGKITVKALAVAGNGDRQSPVVTKTFEVQYSPPPEVQPFDDGMEFQQDLQREKSKMQLERAAAELLHASKTAWADKRDLEEAKLRESARRALEEARLYNDSRHPGLFSHHGPMELPRDPLAPAHYRRMEDPYFPEEYTTDAIRALQNMRMHNNNRDFNFSTATAGRHASTSEWMPTAYAPQNARTPGNPYHYYNNHEYDNGSDIDIPLSRVPPPATPSFSSQLTRKLEMRTVGSQTVGPFFPSQSRLEQMEKELEEKRALEKELRQERPPLLTAFSPGRGYWRRQVEHICQHLKAHAQGDAEFRALVGVPKLGKISSSAIRDGDGEFSITMTFNVKNENNKGLYSSSSKVGYPTRSVYKGRPPSARQHLYSNADDDIMSEDSLTIRSVTSARSGRRRPIRRPKPKKKTVPRVMSLDAKLLKEVSSEGKGSSSELQQLIDEGADPDARNKSGVPALHLAVSNQLIDLIYVLCDAGADVNVKGPSSRKGNTALHEAVSLGATGIRTVDALLRCGADQNIRNDRGETAFEMATKAGLDTVVRRFAAALGQSQVQKLIQPH